MNGDTALLLLIVVPLVSAPLVLISPGTRLPWLLCQLVSAFCLLDAVFLLATVLDAGAVGYQLGGWPPPLGIEYRADLLSTFLAVIIDGVAVLTLMFAPHSIRSEIPVEKTAAFYATFLLCLVGLLGIVVTGDIFNLFVFLEVSSLSSYALVSMGAHRRALNAAFQYLIMGTIGATFYLIGVGLLYSETGTLNMADLGDRLPALLDRRTVHTGLAFIVAGVALKLALFPLHFWLPNAYTEAPAVVTAFLAGTATKVALYVLIRILTGVFGVGVLISSSLDMMLIVVGSVAVVVASLQALVQTNAKRMLAFSSISQVGYMAIGLGLTTVAGMTATLVHVFNHAIIKSALFLALGALVFRVGEAGLTSLSGLGRKMPWTTLAIVIAGLSLVGIPGTAGFISKWLMVQAALEQGAYVVAIVIVTGSLIAAAYVWKLLETLYSGQASEDIKEVSAGMLLPVWVLALANLYFGLQTEWTLGVASEIASHLYGGSVD